MELKEQNNLASKFYLKDIASYLAAIIFGATLGLLLCKLI
jgi:hypothetical protein